MVVQQIRQRCSVELHGLERHARSAGAIKICLKGRRPENDILKGKESGSLT